MINLWIIKSMSHRVWSTQIPISNLRCIALNLLWIKRPRTSLHRLSPYSIPIWSPRILLKRSNRWILRAPRKNSRTWSFWSKRQPRWQHGTVVSAFLSIHTFQSLRAKKHSNSSVNRATSFTSSWLSSRTLTLIRDVKLAHPLWVAPLMKIVIHQILAQLKENQKEELGAINAKTSTIIVWY